MNTDTTIALLGVLALLGIGVWSALRGRFSARKSFSQPPQEWVHNATQSDVERIVHRDFPAQQVPEVIAVLGDFDNQSEGTRVRVHLATLKLADGNVETLKRYISRSPIGTIGT